MSGETPAVDQSPAEPVADATTPEPPAVETASEVVPGAGPGDHDDLGMLAPTWYVLLCAVPFAAAFLLPMVVIYQQQNAVPPVSAAAAAWAGVGTGWLLWAVGLAFWLLGRVVLAQPRARAPHAWGWWDRMTRAWMLVVLVWGLVASLAVIAMSWFLDHVQA